MCLINISLLKPAIKIVYISHHLQISKLFLNTYLLILKFRSNLVVKI